MPDAVTALEAKKAYFETLEPGKVESIVQRKAREAAKADADDDVDAESLGEATIFIFCFCNVGHVCSVSDMRPWRWQRRCA